ncbi:hypothetical protein TIFTF001_033516 [Ficus carica]|uniref:Ethylene-responsive nuclear protein n=1 Tax=Ficus carica TaxID=3494 RepID=A0AA88E0T7_FICCA|nr:hypothetical protein TIFTF001_033516 [Ficus carica]
MPLPWKKTRVTRISRIVADLQSPKRGGSLVVETGFPTSLIDLFVKNRDRLKKPSIKKKKKSKTHRNDNNQLENDTGDLRAPDPIPTNSHPGFDDSTIRIEPICEEAENSAPSESVEGEDEEETRVESETHDDQSRVVVFLSALKVFAVVVLALSTKKLTVGITLSAFVLLFLEYVGKSLILRFLELFRYKKEVSELVGGHESKSSIEEIEVVEANNNGKINSGVNNEESLNERADLELFIEAKRCGFSDTKEVVKDGEGEDLVVEKKKSNSKKAKIRAKIIEKFVPKKLRGSKRGKKDGQGEDKVERFEQEQEQQAEDQGSDVREIREIEIEEEKEGRFYEVDEANELLMVSEEKQGGQREQKREGRKGNWVYITLFLIVLVGLSGGRVLALLLTIAWCFVLKLIGRQRRSSLVISS